MANLDPVSARPDWSYFPLVMCLTMKDQPERRAEAEAEFRRVGIERVVFFCGERQKDRDKSMIDSHRACLQYAVDQGAPHALIFEDDVIFQEGVAENLKRMTDFLKSRQDWNIFLLGGFIFKKKEYCTPHILRGGALTLHAYVVRTEYGRELIARRPCISGMSVDLFYNLVNHDQMFVHVDPLMAVQRANATEGDWDTRKLNSSGWLSKAMIYTALDKEGRKNFKEFPATECLRIRNGCRFFLFYRWWLQRKLAKIEARVARGAAPPTPNDGLHGEYVIADLTA